MQDGPNDDENPNATLPNPEIFSNMAAWGHASISEYDTENDEMMRALCIEAEGLLGLAQEVMEKTSRIRNELQGCIEAWSMPDREAMEHILTNPEEILPEGCEQLAEHVRELAEHSYSVAMRASTYQKQGRDNAKVAEHKRAWQHTDRLRVANTIGSLARQKDQRAVPPLVLMRSIDKLYACCNSHQWSRECKEQSILSKSATERYLSKARWFRPTPIFGPESAVPHDTEVSKVYSYCAYDNLEFTMPVEFERIKKGELVKSTLLHTVTSKPRTTLPQPYPNPTPTLTLTLTLTLPVTPTPTP